MNKPSRRAEQDALRAQMHAAGMNHDEIAAEFARRYRLRPRVAHRYAHGWTQQQAADRINAHAARTGLDPDGAATMTAPWLSELESWPLPPRRRPTQQMLVQLAGVYGCDLHSLLDLDDREHMPPADMLLINAIRVKGVTTSTWRCAGAASAGSVPEDGTAAPDDEPWVGPIRLAWDKRGEMRPREPLAGWTVERMVIVAARESADFGRVAGRSNMSPLTTEQFHADLAWLAERYPNRPVAPSFADVVELRDHAFTLLEDRRQPDQTRDLYVIAGTLCGMLANASFDLGYPDAAATQARTAFLCGELAGHNGVRCWVRGMQSLIAYWQGRVADAVSLAHDGWAFVPERGTARVRVAALEARAAGRLGDKAAMLDALRRADQARDKIVGDDEPGGMLAFPASKQFFYAASAYLGLNHHALSAGEWAARAEQAAGTSIGLYEASPAGEQRLGELSLARLDLAAAQLERSAFDGAAQTIRIVLETTTRRPTDSVLRRLRQLATMTDRPDYRRLRPAQHLREEILTTCTAAADALGRTGEAGTE